jgi:Flp pilus assembly pilin Flp
MTMKRFWKNQDGVSVTEFGLIAPPLLMMLLGTFDVGHSYYVRAVLNGALYEAARESSLEGASSVNAREQIDKKLIRTIQGLVASADVVPVRRYYKTFSEAANAKAETIIVDYNNNGLCDIDENYVDANLNNKWDADGGNDGQGGAKDVVIIKVTVKYQRLFPVGSLLGFGDNVTIVSDSILANQPYGLQQKYTTAQNRPCVP